MFSYEEMLRLIKRVEMLEQRVRQQPEEEGGAARRGASRSEER